MVSPTFSRVTIGEKELRTELGKILSFPDHGSDHASDAHSHAESTAYDPRQVFLTFIGNRPFRPIWFARLWRAFDALSKLRVAQEVCRVARGKNLLSEECGNAERTESQAWKSFRREVRSIFFSKDVQPAPEEEVNQVRVRRKGGFEDCYGAARERAASAGMSGVFGDAHRGGVIASYAFAAVAVLFAVLGGLAHAQHWPIWVQAVFAAGEIAAIVVMFILQRRAKGVGWNLAYTHSRILAEALRHMEYLGPMGIHTVLPRLPSYLRRDRRNPPPEELWAVWYFRALVRMSPLRLKGAGARSLAAQRANLKKWVVGQIDYHESNSTKQGLLHRDIENVSLVALVVVFLFALLHLVDVVFHLEIMFIPSLVVCIGGPALIAAMHGFSSQIENVRLMRNSTSMQKLLSEHLVRIESLDLSHDPDGAETVWGLAGEGLAVSSLMMEESAGWSLLYTNTDIHAG